jgi:hypothetical protein
MDGGLRKSEDIPADAAVCDEAVGKAGGAGVASAGAGGVPHFRSARGSAQRALDASDGAAAAGTAIDETHEHNVVALSDKAVSLGRAARAILLAHDAADSGADARTPLGVAAAAAAASHVEVGAATAADTSAAMAAASSASDAADATLSSAAEVDSDYTKSHIVPTSEQDLLYYLCGRTIAQTHLEEAHPPVAGQSGFTTCIARRAKGTDAELNGDKVLAAYYAAAGGDRAAILAALGEVCNLSVEETVYRSGATLTCRMLSRPVPIFLSTIRTPTHTTTTTTAHLVELL